MTSRRLVQFLWHLHQPYYSVPGRPSNLLPWVRLHSIKAYYDMGRMLERYPRVACVVNFSGSLIKQIHEYVEEGKRDTWWDLTLKHASTLSDHDKRQLLKHFFSINWETCIRPLPRYWELLEKRGPVADAASIESFTTADWRDLQVLFNLAWFGFCAREEFELLPSLIAQGAGFEEHQKEELLRLQLHTMSTILPMYRRLHESGQIEVSLTPMYHPIVPLVIDTDAAARATPERPRPPRFTAPDDARFHIRAALEAGRDMIGIDVRGMWPSEGSVSPEAIALFAEEGLRWVASDEDVLQRSRAGQWTRRQDLYRPWRLRAHDQPALFFRDHGLSDQIGFSYSKNPAEVGVTDLLNRIRQIPPVTETCAPVVSIILDGENPWEHYPDDGKQFLHLLYQRLSEADDIETTYPSRYLDDHGDEGTLDTLHSGSWILGNYQIWIGHHETNRGWELLGRARQALVEATEAGRLAGTELNRAWEALYIAEGSDWFWWYGDDFSSDHDADFDRLFRAQLRHIYQAIGQETPREVETPIITSRQSEMAFSPPHNLIHPNIDGLSEYFYEWAGAAVYRNSGAHGAMFENTRYVNALRLGFDLEKLYVRIDPGPDFHDEPRGLELRMQLRTARRTFVVVVDFESGPRARLTTPDSAHHTPLAQVARADSVEFALPLSLMEVDEHEELHITFGVFTGPMEVEHHPADGALRLVVPDESFDMRNWMV
jgi:alpha-amylase/alpha-mannosidase (GH57 family)